MQEPLMARGLLIGDLKWIYLNIISSTRYYKADVWFRQKVDALVEAINDFLRKEFNLPEEATMRSLSEIELLPLELSEMYDDLDALGHHWYLY